MARTFLSENNKILNYEKLEWIFHINSKMFFIPCLHELSAFFDDFKKAVEVGSYLFLKY